MITFHTRRAMLTLAVGTVLAVPVRASEAPRTYAALSLIADGLRNVGQEATTGSLIANNPRATSPLAFDVLELPALRAVLGAVMAADAKAKVMPLKITDTAVYEQQNTYIEADRAKLPSEILEPLRQGGVTHLVLLTRHRAAARMDSDMGMLGSGTVEGVGFYLDREYQLRQRQRSEITTGYLAPFVYLKASLIDLKTLRVVNTQISTYGRVFTASGKAVGADPWMILSDAEKIQRLREMIQQQVTSAVTKLLVGSA